MVEAEKWMINPLKSKLAHYTLLSFPDTDGPKISRCKTHKIDNSWSPWEGHERKCGNCEMSVELEKLGTTTEKQEKRFELWKKWDKEKEKGER